MHAPGSSPLTSDLPDIAADIFARLRARNPSVHCITNAVAQNFTANVLLAAGAIPSMTVAPDEVGSFVARADALLQTFQPLHLREVLGLQCLCRLTGRVELGLPFGSQLGTSCLDRAGLFALGRQAGVPLERLVQHHRATGAAARRLGFAGVHERLEERAGGEDHRARAVCCVSSNADSNDARRRSQGSGVRGQEGQGDAANARQASSCVEASAPTVTSAAATAGPGVETPVTYHRSLEVGLLSMTLKDTWDSEFVERQREAADALKQWRMHDALWEVKELASVQRELRQQAEAAEAEDEAQAAAAEADAEAEAPEAQAAERSDPAEPTAGAPGTEPVNVLNSPSTSRCFGSWPFG